jgi:hypothetical protein
MAWLRAFALFALLVAVPFLVEELLGKHPRMPIGPIKVSDSFWHDALSYSGFGILVLLFLGFLIVLLLFLPRAYQISEWLKLAEREMNNLLRAWGGGLAADNRRGMARERAEWLSMIPDSNPAALADVYKSFFDLNQDDLKSGGPQGGAMGKARMTAFLLREIYEGNVESAQRKVFDETKINDGKIPFVAPGLRQLLGLDQFNKDTGFEPGAGVSWFPLMLAVKLYGYPKRIIMVKPGKDGAKIRVTNWQVLEELTTAQG